MTYLYLGYFPIITIFIRGLTLASCKQWMNKIQKNHLFERYESRGKESKLPLYPLFDYIFLFHYIHTLEEFNTFTCIKRPTFSSHGRAWLPFKHKRHNFSLRNDSFKTSSLLFLKLILSVWYLKIPFNLETSVKEEVGKRYYLS